MKPFKILTDFALGQRVTEVLSVYFGYTCTESNYISLPV